MRHEAIRNLYPNVVVIQDDIGCFDQAGQIVELDIAAVEVETTKLINQAKSIEYKRQRAPEYPPLQDLADALYWQNKGDSTKMQEYLANVEAVKQKYPKSVSYVDNIITRDSSQGGNMTEPGQPADTVVGIADSITGAQ